MDRSLSNCIKEKSEKSRFFVVCCFVCFVMFCFFVTLSPPEVKMQNLRLVFISDGVRVGVGMVVGVVIALMS